MAIMPAVRAKVRVSGEDYGIGKQFGHAHEACVGKVDGQVGVFLHELEDRVQVLPKSERDQHCLPVEELHNRGARVRRQDMKCLR